MNFRLKGNLIADVYSRLSWGKSGGMLPKEFQVLFLEIGYCTL
jgi:hypothetical protein